MLSPAIIKCPPFPGQADSFIQSGMNRFLSYGAFLMALAIALGAFGAHGLKDRLTAYGSEIYSKAVFYHVVHALGILIVAILPALQLLEADAARRVCLMFMTGIALFSGSLYILAITEAKWLGMITPFGGLLMIAGWTMLGVSFLRG